MRELVKGVSLTVRFDRDAGEVGGAERERVVGTAAACLVPLPFTGGTVSGGFRRVWLALPERSAFAAASTRFLKEMFVVLGVPCSLRALWGDGGLVETWGGGALAKDSDGGGVLSVESPVSADAS